MLSQMEEAFTAFEKNDAIFIIIFKSAGGKAFAAGADISKLKLATSLHALQYGMQDFYTKIERSRKVTLAIIDGFALGGGFELALACDIRIATTNAKFGLPELNLGILPGAGGTQRLPRIVGKGHALDLILTGKMISGQEAFDMGAVTYLADVDAVDTTIATVVKQITRKGPIAASLVKLTVHSGADVDMNTALWIEKLSNAVLFGTDDKTEGTSAFIEKRQANFKNR